MVAAAEGVYAAADSRASASRAKLESVFKEFTDVLHPNHELFFNLSLPLINCCGHSTFHLAADDSGRQCILPVSCVCFCAVRDYRAKLTLCKLVVENSEACWPKMFSPKTNYLQGIADTYLQLIDARANGFDPSPTLFFPLPICHA